MGKVLVYSCVTGNYDNLEAGLLASTPVAEADVAYVLYTDRLLPGSAPQSYQAPGAEVTWELRPLVWRHPLCGRRTARWHKVNSHLVAGDASHTIWLDGTQRIRPVALKTQLVQPLAEQHELATFRHPERVCAYQELQACIHWKKDNPELMRRQLEQYRQAQYPPYFGLVETSCLLRANTQSVTTFNQLWWQQIQNHSYRDQLSFNYAAWCLDQPYGHIPGQRLSSPFFEYVPHRHEA